MLSTSKSGRIIVVAAFAAFLATFNETYLNVGFNPIMEDFGVSVSTVQWLAAAYMLGAAVMVPVSAFMYRSFPTRPLFMITTGILTLGSLVGALAPGFTVLLIGRIIQALGTGMLIPMGMNITLQAAPRDKLGSYMGIMGAMTTLGPSLSVIAAGVLLSFFHWRMLLWVFAGLSFLCLLSGAILLPNIAELTHPRLDAASVVLIGLALIGILYGISTVFTGWVLIALISALLGACCLVLFSRRQKKLSEPLIDLRPLGVKVFSIGVIINMLSLIVIFSMNILLPIFIQSNMGAGAFDASLALFPAILLSCVVAPVAGRICDRHSGKLIIPLGFILICIFASAIAAGAGTITLTVMTILYVPVICGSALIIGPIQSYALSRLTSELNPHGVTIMSTGFQIAGCVGSSLFTGIFSAVSASSGAVSGFKAAGFLAAAVALAGFALAIAVYRIGGAERKKA